MTHIEDVGAEFDAPIEMVWKFLNSEQDHGTSHKNRRNIRGESDGEMGMKVSWEQNVEGNWVKVSNRVGLFPPVAMMVHSIEGPLAGSKFLFYYTPNGAKTGVSAVGEFQSAVIPPAQLKPMVLASFEEAFHEDNDGMRRMMGKK